MHRYYLLLLVLLVFFACQSTVTRKENQAITPAEIEIAKNLIQGAFDDLWGGLDSTKIDQYHTDDFIILEQGEIWDNDRIVAYMREASTRPDRPKRINKMDYISVEKYGPSIQIAYFNHADFVRADTIAFQVDWLESALAVPTPDGWRLKMMHSTRAKK